VKKRKRSQLEEVAEEEEEDQSLGILKKNKNKKKDALNEAGSTPKKKVTIKLPGEVTHSNKEEKTRIPSGLDEMTSKDVQQKTANCIKTFKNGLSIEEMSYGTGKIAKQGHKVHLRYKGHSTGDDGDKYEISKQEQPLVFTMGKGEVMPGLEQGVRGMKPGGVRRLIIPPSLRRKGDVPDCIANNANIVTIVKLLNITN
jgi:FK506-binding nuclear protein